MGAEGSSDFEGQLEPENPDEPVRPAGFGPSDLNPDVGGRGLPAVESGIEVTRLAEDLTSMHYTFTFPGMDIPPATARIVVNERGDVIEPDDAPPERPSPFPFRQPFDGTYEVPSIDEQHKAGRLFNDIHETVFSLDPGNVARTVWLPGIATSTFGMEDVAIKITTCDPESLFAESMGRRLISIEEQAPSDQTGHIVHYHLGDDNIIRRWDAVRPTFADEIRQLWKFRQRRREATLQDPKAPQAADEQARAEAEDPWDDRELAANRGENYLPVGTTEMIEVGRFIGQRLGILDQLPFLDEE